MIKEYEVILDLAIDRNILVFDGEDNEGVPTNRLFSLAKRVVSRHTGHTLVIIYVDNDADRQKVFLCKYDREVPVVIIEGMLDYFKSKGTLADKDTNLILFKFRKNNSNETSFLAGSF